MKKSLDKKKSQKRVLKKQENYLLKHKKSSLLFLILLIMVVVGVYNYFKPLPEGISLEGEIYNLSDKEVEFLYDLTYDNFSSERIYQQEIFDRIFKAINNSERYVLIDMFLWSGKEDAYRDLGKELSNALIIKKKENPSIEIVVITDAFNTNYNSFNLTYFDNLRRNNISVVFTDLDVLRDSRPIYSAFWRVFFYPFGYASHGWLKTPFFHKKIAIRSFFRLLNFKANHRKIAIMDSGDKMISFVVSANPSGSSSKHSNIGFLIKDKIYKDIYKSENAVLRMSGFKELNWSFDFVNSLEENKNVQVQFLTEKKIKDSLIKEIDSSQKGDKIRIAMFYFSERDVLNSLLRANKRGVDIEIIFDPSKYGFGRDKYGIPSRISAEELVKKSNGKIKIKYYKTKDEEFHTKLVFIIKKDKIIIFGGSANLTRRNIDNYNLEADVKIITPLKTNLSMEIQEYFRNLWENRKGIYTIDFNSFRKASLFRRTLSWIQEFTGSGTF